MKLWQIVRGIIGWIWVFLQPQLADKGAVRVIPSFDLDKYLTEDLDASKSWQAVKKGVEKNSLLMPDGKIYYRDSENEEIASVCADAVSQYSNFNAK